jgi:hypothetical protein
MATLNITVSRNGIAKIVADTATISDINEAGELLRASSAATHLLHESVWEHFHGEPPAATEPRVWLPSYQDCLQDKPREHKILVGDGPRDPYDNPPQWFIDSLKKAFPDDYMWEDAVEDLPGGEGEAAVMVFQNKAPGKDHWLDHWGFVGVGYDEDGRGGEEILVSEPYGTNLESLTALVPFLEKVGWTFNIVGRSAHYPSATIRIEIRPKRAS